MDCSATTTTTTTTKHKDPNYNATTISAITSICNSESFSVFPLLHHELVSANSIELNGAASLSDDSGVPLTTNSSISSGDSYRLGMCKFEIELVESDGEVSQFDSLDNCSESGMSAENFNTLKKGPLALIDPPPEFQDSPQTTLVRSSKKCGIGNLRRWTSSQSSFEHLKEHIASETQDIVISSTTPTDNIAGCNDCSAADMYEEKTLKELYATNKHLYSSDSILNIHIDNIYDEPNNVWSSSLGNSAAESQSPLPSPPPPVSIVKIKRTMCPYFQDHTRYFKAIPSEQDNLTNKAPASTFNDFGLSDIHDYDMYYGFRWNTTYHQYDYTLQRKPMYSPLSNNSHHYHNHIYHGSIGYNRPNSRNSLNGRLSSSHNSLSTSSTNKPDDSIFITQAMSHDALLTREISDFYNVPIDSDIYAFPIDMINSEAKCGLGVNKYQILKSDLTQTKESKDVVTKRSHEKKPTNCKQLTKHKKRFNCLDSCDKNTLHTTAAPLVSYTPTLLTTFNAQDKSAANNLNKRDTLQLELNGVNQFYNTIYSASKANNEVARSRHMKNLNINPQKSSTEDVWSSSASNCTTTALSVKNVDKLFGPVVDSCIKNCKTHKDALISEKDKTNNNNVIAIINHNLKSDMTNESKNSSKIETKQQHINVLDSSISKPNVVASHMDKKVPFTLNLKEKICSIFRFRRNRCRSTNNEQMCQLVRPTEDNRKRLQFRALPPLPSKDVGNKQCLEAENGTLGEKEKNIIETRPLQFTSSIEKVKDYGWYWGPLSSEAAEKVLSNEPDGSFIVRDSSDDHYIFSLSFKLNNCVRHVRIEQDQGTFSFGCYAKFKSQTITEFIEKAVEHSRSGRYLFFLHRRPEHGPMRVQLTNPVSRFKHVQSLQHMCRFVILKVVIRKDLIQTLPLPRRLLDYLNYKHCYSEQIETDSSASQASEDESL